ncbi:pyridoxamine 5'-phosphate oxidase family protein [Actinokineospora sp. NBRC 105648]|uniref:pyridoxamine 5'-phosphate oxidase family protein n=1 Tax=Actinokineospora sp. NBRC 105648 TaxID=3032206 RepID=UPI0024A17924|nr:pyridoxamine 5'-phosphate oxidase family protein [Actinokineospora sp. NBRC 105648]GLZ40460.1 hypothetical protein Acsp05_40840 [Actinokineospora sp. NBRC 105648]
MATAPSSRSLTRTEREEFLALPHIAILAVTADDNRPPSALPTWYDYAPGGTVRILLRQDKRKSRLIRHAGVVSVSVQKTDAPYRYVTVEGTVVRQGRPTEEEMAGIGRRYLPADAVEGWVAWELGGGNPVGEPEYVEIRPDRWLTKDFDRG